MQVVYRCAGAFHVARAKHQSRTLEFQGLYRFQIRVAQVAPHSRRKVFSPLNVFPCDEEEVRFRPLIWPIIFSYDPGTVLKENRTAVVLEKMLFAKGAETGGKYRFKRFDITTAFYNVRIFRIHLLFPYSHVFERYTSGCK